MKSSSASFVNSIRFGEGGRTQNVGAERHHIRLNCSVGKRHNAIAGPLVSRRSLLLVAISFLGGGTQRVVADEPPPAKLSDIVGDSKKQLQAVKGTVSAKKGVSVPHDGTVFVILRRAGEAKGFPVAVKKYSNPILPLDFEIGPENTMLLSDGGFPAVVDLTIRLDSDGDPLTKQPKDLIATRKNVSIASAPMLNLVFEKGF
uniref:Uncharacterized protein n=1 Tax=Rhodosorus marinus TaxID=101924 RepID=A0A7S0BH01_9RHOD|mmetsp:Transcript_14974/g.22040  ORF Transcript_14974/g.22040 Transcript_14974/m.22040 type:complete len:202 (+) Transcript_14974:86-691(+)|eukprot:CAMPEP_0184749566 /NCGR_PEP_ID=MMETSP0315-20130426/29090_1 /TAXON_ID=101924 /ORGANISM="Rhodosorus marinus, Strain UTEX LB 2760" /LENGTH=201 /DNA_ID=CAMNT_0027226707 /DNA_START=40 /DNA_END=645 /DNA_ORIENTATION=+